MQKKIIYVDFPNHREISQRTYYRKIKLTTDIIKTPIDEEKTSFYIPGLTEFDLILKTNYAIFSYFCSFNPAFSKYFQNEIKIKSAANDEKYNFKNLELLISNK